MSMIPIAEKPSFIKDIQKLEPSTPAHADNFNAIYSRLLENEVYLEANKANKTIRKEAILQFDNWIGENPPYSYNLGVEEATEDNIIEILPAANLTPEQYEAMLEACIAGGEQTIGSITLLAYGYKPTIDLPIIIFVRE